MASEVKEIKNESAYDFCPENLDHSKLLSYIAENLSFALSDFSIIYNKSIEETQKILSQCEFLEISQNYANYIEKYISCVFIVDESLNSLINDFYKLENIEYQRFYKKNNGKWIIVPKLNCKEKFTNYINEKEIEIVNLQKSDLINAIIYYKESTDLKDKRKNSDYSSGSYGSSDKKRKYKYSNNSNSSHYQYNKYYYNNYKNNNNSYKVYKGRERFNSDGYSGAKSKYYKDNNTTKIEVDLDEIKYPLKIDKKYTMNNLMEVYLKMKEKKYFEKIPQFLVEENEVLGQKPKKIVIDCSFTSAEDTNKGQAINKINENSFNTSGSKVKIPKKNPLSQMKMPFNKFDSVSTNAV